MAQAALRSRPGGADSEARLARAAAAGHGRAFATLYDRYEQRVFNLAFRITGSRDHAARATREAFLDALRAVPDLKAGEPGFGSCLFTATRNASCDQIEQRPPGGDVPGPSEASADAGPPEPEEESERDLASEAEQDQIREAGLRLAEREREVLALGGLDELSYGEIAAIMGTDRGSVPELTARARLSLHDELCGTSLASTSASSEECEQALPLIAMRDDGQLDDEDFQWLLEHLAHCRGCRLRLDAMQEAGAAYSAWEPVAAPPALFRDALAGAAQFTSADWSEVTEEWGAKRSAGRVQGGDGGARGAGRRKGGRAGLDAAVTAAGAAATDALDSLRVAASALVSDAWRRRPQRNRLVTAGLLFLILLGLSGIGAGATLVLRGSDRPEPAVPPAAEADALTEEQPAPVQRAERKRKVDRSAKAKEVQVAPREAVVITPRPVPERRESAAERRRRPAKNPPRRRVPRAEAVPLPKPLPKPTPSPPTSQPAPTTPPVGTPPQLPQPQPPVCKDATGKPVPCPG